MKLNLHFKYCLIVYTSNGGNTMKFNFYTIKRKIKFILTNEDGKYKVIK